MLQSQRYVEESRRALEKHHELAMKSSSEAETLQLELKARIVDFEKEQKVQLEAATEEAQRKVSHVEEVRYAMPRHALTNLSASDLLSILPILQTMAALLKDLLSTQLEALSSASLRTSSFGTTVSQLGQGMLAAELQHHKDVESLAQSTSEQLAAIVSLSTNQSLETIQVRYRENLQLV